MRARVLIWLGVCVRCVCKCYRVGYLRFKFLNCFLDIRVNKKLRGPATKKLGTFSSVSSVTKKKFTNNLTQGCTIQILRGPRKKFQQNFADIYIINFLFNLYLKGWRATSGLWAVCCACLT